MKQSSLTLVAFLRAISRVVAMILFLIAAPFSAAGLIIITVNDLPGNGIVLTVASNDYVFSDSSCLSVSSSNEGIGVTCSYFHPGFGEDLGTSNLRFDRINLYQPGQIPAIVAATFFMAERDSWFSHDPTRQRVGDLNIGFSSDGENGPLSPLNFFDFSLDATGAVQEFDLPPTPGCFGCANIRILITTDVAELAAAPEPATLTLVGLGLAGLGFSRRRRASRSQVRSKADPAPTPIAGQSTYLSGFDNGRRIRAEGAPLSISLRVASDEYAQGARAGYFDRSAGAAGLHSLNGGTHA